jgi:hypothetical protein
MESFYKTSDAYRDTILKHKISQNKEFSIYEIQQNDKFLISYISAGKSVHPDSIILISGQDTSNLSNTRAMIKRSKKVKSRFMNFTYYIQVLK